MGRSPPKVMAADRSSELRWLVVNPASSEVLTRISIAKALHGRRCRCRAVGALWTVRLQRMSPGWFDVATLSPLIDTGHAERELGYSALMSKQDGRPERGR